MKNKIILSIFSLFVGSIFFGGAVAWALPGTFIQGGNAFAETATLGTTDNFDLRIITNNSEKARITSSGAMTLAGTLNGLTISTTTGTLSLANGSTLATSGDNSITLTSSGATNVILPTTGTLATLSGTETLTNKTISGASNTLTVREADLSLLDNITANVSTTRHGFAPKAPNDPTKYLDGTGIYSAPIPKMLASTSFESSSRFAAFATSGGNVVFGPTGATINTSATISSAEDLRYVIFGDNNAEAGSPIVSFSIHASNAGTDSTAFFGLGGAALTVDGSGIDYNDKHIGFKIVRSGNGTINVYATQGDGTSETVSSSLFTLGAGFNEQMDLILKVNGNSSVDYYWRKSGGTLSTPTTLSGNMPTQVGDSLQMAVSNVGVATLTKYVLLAASYQR